jgi:hypothetical protein
MSLGCNHLCISIMFYGSAATWPNFRNHIIMSNNVITWSLTKWTHDKIITELSTWECLLEISFNPQYKYQLVYLIPYRTQIILYRNFKFSSDIILISFWYHFNIDLISIRYQNKVLSFRYHFNIKSISKWYQNDNRNDIETTSLSLI